MKCGSYEKAKGEAEVNNEAEAKSKVEVKPKRRMRPESVRSLAKKMTLRTAMKASMCTSGTCSATNTKSTSTVCAKTCTVGGIPWLVFSFLLQKRLCTCDFTSYL